MVIRLFPKHIFRQKVKESFLWSFVRNCKSCLSSATLPPLPHQLGWNLSARCWHVLLIFNFVKVCSHRAHLLRHRAVATLDVFLEMSWRTRVGSPNRRNRAFIVVTHKRNLCSIRPHHRFHPLSCPLSGGPMRNSLCPSNAALRQNALSRCLSNYTKHLRNAILFDKHRTLWEDKERSLSWSHFGHQSCGEWLSLAIITTVTGAPNTHHDNSFMWKK